MPANEDKNKELTVKQRLSNFLESRKMRKTSERFAILEKVWSMQVHFDVETLYNELERDAYHVSLATVYNTIDLLMECGLLRKHQFNSQPAQYEVALGSHFHLVCTQCGKVTEINIDIKDTITANIKKFHLTHYSLYLYGICNKCHQAIKRRKARMTKNKLQ